ncbi:hypothetical protein L7F22_058581 [Adiantum nelumboides]|nr:hypothetical protein [Adiantum nelumboides]
MDLAREFLADEGFLVTMGVVEHIDDFIAEASRVGLVLLRTWTLMCTQKAYQHLVTREAVLDLTMCLWYRAGYPMPCSDREAGETIAERLFRVDRNHMIDDCVCPMDIDGVIAKGGTERSSLFFRWLLATFTKPHNYVLDVFAGCGGMGQACAE